MTMIASGDGNNEGCKGSKPQTQYREIVYVLGKLGSRPLRYHLLSLIYI